MGTFLVLCVLGFIVYLLARVLNQLSTNAAKQSALRNADAEYQRAKQSALHAAHEIDELYQKTAVDIFVHTFNKCAELNEALVEDGITNEAFARTLRDLATEMNRLGLASVMLISREPADMTMYTSDFRPEDVLETTKDACFRMGRDAAVDHFMTALRESTIAVFEAVTEGQDAPTEARRRAGFQALNHLIPRARNAALSLYFALGGPALLKEAGEAADVKAAPEA
jgi:hypothetical protein